VDLENIINYDKFNRTTCDNLEGVDEMLGMVNVNKLKGQIVEKGFNIESLADSIGMDRSTFYRRLNNHGETFSIREANLICNQLNLNKDEAMAIFFTNFVA
ncbi:MAG: helix-turn-helix domain-containing protein, partial [Solibacillus sp.]